MSIGIATENASIDFLISQDKDGKPIVVMQVIDDDDKPQKSVFIDKDDMKQLIRVLNFLGQEM